MKVSTRVEYGIIALADIAINGGDGKTVSSSDISERQDISQKYLEQIIISLRQGGFVKGQKGSRGGYVLSRPADRIYLSEVLNALDNSILADAYEDGADNTAGMRGSVNFCLWNKINGYMRRFTEQMTLADIIAEHRENAEISTENMYYI